MRNLLFALAALAATVGCADKDLDDDGVENEEDCDALNAAAYPGAPEVCDGVDNDCDGEIDEEATDLLTFYADSDGDRYGDADATVQACVAPAGYVAAAGDCDDANADVSEGATEICNGEDDNCDGSVDEGDAAPTTWYADADSDRFGDDETTTDACTQPEGYVAAGGDCDDASATVHPGATEVCNDADDDCDGEPDDGAVDKLQWWDDADNDGFGAGDPTLSCYAPGDTWVLQPGDCDDTTDARYPGNTEVCDELDNDCDTNVDDDAVDANTWYRDADADTYGWADTSVKSCAAPAGYVADADDCDDLAASAYPGGTEVCDGLDNDCNSAADDDATDALTWYADTDGDGAGDPDSSVVACEAPSGYVANDLDCDDTDSSRYDGCFALEGVVLETCGATGRNGPTQSACDAEYSGTDLEGLVSVTGGVQTLTVPESGVYGITAVGAAGFSPTSSYKGGKGAQVYGEFALKRGDTLQIVVGQVGSGTGTTGNGGGGGGTFVATGAGTAMLVAGGGGGTRADARANGCDAEVGQYGSGASGYNDTRTSGTCVAKTTGLGSGGGVSASSYGSGGAGFTGDGTGDSSWGVAAKSFTNGAVGGQTTTSCGSVTGDGGFGGGGSGGGCWGGGGGGGYSGGDGGFIAGGGGSYLSGSNQASTAAVSTGDGSVTIEKL